MLRKFVRFRNEGEVHARRSYRGRRRERDREAQRSTNRKRKEGAERERVFRFSLRFLPLIARDGEIVKNKVALRVPGDGGVDTFVEGLHSRASRKVPSS